MFGGSDPERQYSNVLWSWYGSRWETLTDDGPPPWIHAALAYDAGRGRLVLHGGIRSRKASFGDTWEWDGRFWQQRGDATEGPGVRDHHAMVYDAGRVVLYGGIGADGRLDDLWEWDGASWSVIEQPPRSAP